MHVAIEKARKAAGISGLTKNYPDSDKQRGCGYWAAFIGSLGTSLGQMDDQQKVMLAKIADLSDRLAAREHDLSEVKDRAAKNGVETLAVTEGWSPDKRLSAMRTIAG